ncbi:hypothetical protein [Caudoviricetes sp.]|nr:hypothetical protein [Caudoviricetes sp.]
MATVTLQNFDCLTEYVANAVVNFGSHSFKIVLTNTEPDIGTDAILADITQIANSGGYTQGGFPVTITGVSRTGSLTKIIIEDKLFTASGGTVDEYQWAVLYDDSTSSPVDALVGVIDLGTPRQLPNGDVLSFNFSEANGAIQIDNA